ncbi:MULTISPECIES: serine hydrolase [unclassified Francisella]|uniref:serine hydrolase n=1 Tax=unclassified Francisella TaxID=2610885 RepID=UPI002E3360EC|nr:MULTISPECIES: serine hydrolase [unclassified Francisella]MED7819689.1 serine hydrolase [Francisella sp. 19S2-4]MED7830489.1 serine hydrolase [Francisella sp. 19S2-10]
MNFPKLENVVNYDIDHGFSGVAISISHLGEEVYKKSFGYACRYDKTGKELKKRQVLEQDMLFDVASITKIFATTYAIMYLYQRNIINLDALITDYIPEFKFANTSYIPSIRDLLSHASGVAPFFDFYNNHTAGLLYSQDRQKTINFLKTKMSVSEPAGKYCIYSDIGMQILGCVIEAVTGKQLDIFLEDKIYSVIGLKNTCFNPLDRGYSPEKIVATQVDGHCNFGTTSFNNIKTETLRGYVHDEKALYSMAGVAGHAGLFSTIDDTSKLAELIYKDNEIFSIDTVRYFSQPCDINPAFALGFWTARGRKNRHFFGEKCSDQTIGHTGFTGQCLISDPANKVTIMIMSNSVHSPIIYPRIFEGKTFRTGVYGQLVDSIYEDLGI